MYDNHEVPTMTPISVRHRTPRTYPRIMFLDREMGKDMVDRFEMKKDVNN